MQLESLSFTLKNYQATRKNDLTRLLLIEGSLASKIFIILCEKLHSVETNVTYPQEG